MGQPNKTDRFLLQTLLCDHELVAVLAAVTGLCPLDVKLVLIGDRHRLYVSFVGHRGHSGLYQTFYRLALAGVAAEDVAEQRLLRHEMVVHRGLADVHSLADVAQPDVIKPMLNDQTHVTLIPASA
jgi:hypothetical protein